MELLDDVLAYRFLNGANISEQHKQHPRVTLPALSYDNKKQANIKVEPTSETRDVYYGFSRGNNPWYKVVVEEEYVIEEILIDQKEEINQ